MKTKLVAYYDKKLGVYTQPIAMQDVSVEDMIEQVRRMCANPGIKENLFDNDLYVLGSYDDKLASFELLAKPEFIVSLGDFRYLQERDHGEASRS